MPKSLTFNEIRKLTLTGTVEGNHNDNPIPVNVRVYEKGISGPLHIVGIYPVAPEPAPPESDHKVVIVFSCLDQMNEHSTARLQLMEDELCKLPNLPYESMLRLECIRMVLKIRQGREPLPITETPIACNMVHGLEPCFQCGRVATVTQLNRCCCLDETVRRCPVHA